MIHCSTFVEQQMLQLLFNKYAVQHFFFTFTKAVERKLSLALFCLTSCRLFNGFNQHDGRRVGKPSWKGILIRAVEDQSVRIFSGQDFRITHTFIMHTVLCLTKQQRKQ